MIISSGICSEISYARKSKEIKEAERAAYWGVFADVFQANLGLARKSKDSVQIQQQLIKANEHLRSVDQTAAGSFLAIGQEILDIKVLVDSQKFNEASLSISQLQRKLISEYAQHIAPVVPPDINLGERLFGEYCSGCHGDGLYREGKLAKSLKRLPKPLFAEETQEVLSPFGIYAIGIHGVDQSEMISMFDIIDIDQLWYIAFYVSTLGPAPTEVSPDFFSWLTNHNADFSLSTLAVSSDRELQVKLKNSGWPCDKCTEELSYLRRQWAFSGAATRIGDMDRSPRVIAKHRALILLLISIIFPSKMP